MAKKGDMSIQTIVVAVLSITVLLILIVIFRTQIVNIAKGFTSVGDDAKAGASGTKCQTILGDRVCGKDTTRFPTDKYELTPLPKPCKVYNDPKDISKGCNEDGWIDCNSDCYEINKIVN